MDMWVSALLVVVFVLIGGVFAATELALVSLRESQLDRLEERGPRGRKVAAIAREPNRFLAAVQIGVTLAGFFSAAYGASALSPALSPVLVRLGLPQGAADTTAFILLTLVVAYLSLVLGELAPKRLALQRATSIALLVGPPLDTFSRLMRPVIWLLSRSTDAVVTVLGGDPQARGEDMTAEELHDLVLGHEALDSEERTVLDGVFRAAERTVAVVMRPRADIVFLRGALTVREAAAEVRGAPFSRYPVIGEDFDEVLGFVHLRDILAALAHTEEPRRAEAPLRSIVRPVLSLPATKQLMPTLAEMRRSSTHLGMVLDEYGGTAGLVTLEDLLEEFVGEINDEYDLTPRFRRTGSFDAGLSIEDFARESGVELPDGPYETVAGFVLYCLEHLAEVGESVDLGDHRLVVTEVERRRIRTVRLEDQGSGSSSTHSQR
ncbi:hemolysin family protein [Brevibacterium samyangense]|uniref:Hemolysin family protein n=1 Tax=Brevibacterium samyangense TaxID=366888 RepID=A0ABP5EY23_9MICO